ncbi:hypothetical protein AB1L42_01540 [Thalassoglobus sp. JC818]|uniref:hypothetical protein n=1 Tax=Thalassoglobus sp. JC818 TaxID=3232136 RepID=UPI003458568E
MSSYTDLALDPTSIRVDLINLGIDESLYSDSELKSVMTVSDIILRNEITNKTDELELEMYDFEIQSGKLQASQIFFNELMTTLDNESVTLAGLMDFMTKDYTFLNIGDASKMTLDYEITSPELTVAGFGPDATATYSTMQDYLDALTGGDYQALLLGLKAAMDEGAFESAISGIYNGTTGIEQVNVYSSWTDFADGSLSYSVKVANEDSSAPTVYLGLDEVREYLIAKALQTSGFIGEDVYIEPVIFASSSQPAQAGALANEFATWHQLFYGKTTIAFDATAGTLTVDYNAPAATSEFGYNLTDYFDDTPVRVEYWENANKITSSWDKKFNTDLTDSNSETIEPFESETFNAYLVMTAAYAYDDLSDAFDLTSGKRNPLSDGAPKVSWEYRWDDKRWSDFSGDSVLDEDYMERESIKELYTDIGGGVEGFAAQGELNLLSISTLLTEWSEYHAGWDTIHKYVTDAIDRVIEMMK